MCSSLATHVGEYNLILPHTALSSFAKNVLLPNRWEAEQPQHAVRHTLEHAHPAVEDLRIDLIQLVEIAEHEYILGDAVLCTSHASVGHIDEAAPRLAMVIYEIRVRHGDDFFVVELTQIGGNRDVVAYDVLYVGCAHGAAKPQVGNLLHNTHTHTPTRTHMYTHNIILKRYKNRF